jgi:hypothetical protein
MEYRGYVLTIKNNIWSADGVALGTSLEHAKRMIDGWEREAEYEQYCESAASARAERDYE